MFGGIKRAALWCQFFGGVYDPARRGDPRRTALQRHGDYFDSNGDGVITVGEARKHLAELDLKILRSALLTAVLINLFIGRKTWGVWYPTLTVNVDAIHRGIHGSHTGLFGRDGNFDRDLFEKKFAEQWDTNGDGCIDQSEMDSIMARKAQKGLRHVLGRFFASSELPVVFKKASQVVDGRPVLTREQLLRFFEGDLWDVMTGRNAGEAADASREGPTPQA